MCITFYRGPFESTLMEIDQLLTMYMSQQHWPQAVMRPIEEAESYGGLFEGIAYMSGPRQPRAADCVHKIPIAFFKFHSEASFDITNMT
jgi:hypothetical protein